MIRDSFLAKVCEAFKNRKRKFVFRSSVTGQFVTREEAEAHPDTTMKQEVK